MFKPMYVLCLGFNCEIKKLEVKLYPVHKHARLFHILHVDYLVSFLSEVRKCKTLILVHKYTRFNNNQIHVWSNLRNKH